jgi:PAS domain S-box-containing protein
MSRATILVVEDDGVLALLLQTILIRQGYKVAGPLASGEATIAFLAEQHVDLILMDIELAGAASGIETAVNIRRTSDTPLIFLTGSSRDRLIEDAKIASPHGYLIKPVEEQALIATVEMAMHRHAIDRALLEKQKILAEKETALRKKLQAVLDPDGDIGALQLADIIDGPALQAMMEDFYRLTGIGIGILDTAGKVLVGVGWQEICTEFHRRHPDTLKNCLASDVVLSSGIPAGTVKAYRCKNNLWDLMTPIEVDGRHLGNVCLGQFFYDDEIPDYDFFRNQAKKYGFDESAYLAALERVPRWSREKVATTMAFYTGLSRLISTLSYNTVKLSRALAEKDDALQQLGENRVFQMSLLENIPIPVFSKDTSGRYLLCNSAYKKFFDKTSEQILGADTFSLHPPEQAQFSHNKDDELFRTGQPQIYETKVRDGRGELRTCIIHKALLTDSVGITTGLVGAILDITERNKADEERKKLQAQLMQAQKMEAIGTLAGGIAHDFNNILGAMLGYAELAREDSPSGSTIARDLDQILKAGNRAKDLVKQILAFSRQVKTERLPLKPAIIIKETIKLLRASLPTTITILPAIDPDTAPILADPTQIHQLTMNLCTNAFHAMEEHGGTLSISLSNVNLIRSAPAGSEKESAENFVHLSIRDTGPGIPPDIRERIFDPYFTTKETGKGTGMGLAIVHGIVTSYGGTITCDSQLGQGTTFHVSLPALTEQEQLNAGKPARESHIPFGAERILFIDDEEILVDMTRTMLERLGYHVTVRGSSLEALTSFQNQPDAYDLVITDQTMPGMTGIDLARRMLQIRPDLPIILCTGYSSQITEDKAKAAGIKGFALKPLTKNDISGLIRKVLNNTDSNS